MAHEVNDVIQNINNPKRSEVGGHHFRRFSGVLVPTLSKKVLSPHNPPSLTP